MDKSQGGKSLAKGEEFRTIYQHQPFQDSKSAIKELSINQCKDDDPSCNPGVAENPCTKKKKKIKKTNRATSNNSGDERKYSTMVHLPKIESNERIEYKVELPIRAAVQMQYLMHSTKVLLNEPEFIDDLYDKLIHEESKQLRDQSRMRELAEKNRVKKLVIQGDMIPPPDMEYLYDHPVFKVNKMLKELNQYEQVLALGPKIKDKITPVEPYEFDGDLFFKELHKSGTYWIPSEERLAEGDKLVGKIKRAKLRLKEKLAKEKLDEEMKHILFDAADDIDQDTIDDSVDVDTENIKDDNNEDVDDDNPDNKRKLLKTESVVSVSNSDAARNARKQNVSKRLKILANEQQKRETYFRRRSAILKKEEEIRKKKVQTRQDARDRVILEAKERQRLAYVAKYYKYYKDREIPIVDNEEQEGEGAGENEEKTSKRSKFYEMLHQPSTPDDVNETASFVNCRKYFGLRGAYEFEQFQPFDNPLIQKYLDGASKAEEFCNSGHDITDMYTRCGIYGTEMVNKLDRGWM